jgi:hypothetical protein
MDATARVHRGLGCSGESEEAFWTAFKEIAAASLTFPPRSGYTLSITIRTYLGNSMSLKCRGFAVTHRLLIAIGFAIPVQTWAEADTSKRMEQVEAAQAFRQGRLLDTFGTWEIREGLVASTYLLIGKSASDGESQFWLHCDQHNLVTIAVPVMELSGSERLRSRTIIIRSDTGLERTLSLVVFENFVAVAVDYGGGGNNKVVDFLDVLQASNDTVTISYGEKSFEYDVQRLPAARARFEELCGRAPR